MSHSPGEKQETDIKLKKMAQAEPPGTPLATQAPPAGFFDEGYGDQYPFSKKDE